MAAPKASQAIEILLAGGKIDSRSNVAGTAMQRMKTIVETQKDHITTLRIISAVAVLGMIGLWYGWASAPEEIDVHVAPNFTDGITMPVNFVPEPNVYLFANHIFQQLQRWETDGDKDFARNIYRLQYFLTPRYQRQLDAEFQQKYERGELRKKRRYGQTVPGHTYEPERVETLGGDAWIVYLDYEITEFVGGMKTKEVQIRYPLRVVRYDIDRQKNEWGLALDGYPVGAAPRRLDDIRAEELAMQR